MEQTITEEQIQKIRDKVLRSITSLKPDANPESSFFGWKMASSSKDLPQYYLVHFLLIGLLGFDNFGKGEKTAWAIPVVYQGSKFSIEYRKFGMGIYFLEKEGDLEDKAKEVVSLINRGVKLAKPFFSDLAKKSLEGNKLNVQNNHYELYDKYSFFNSLYYDLKSKKIVPSKKSLDLDESLTSMMDSYNKKVDLNRRTKHVALAAIESFFSWTEHVLVQMAVLQGRVKTGVEVSNLANSEWKEKFKSNRSTNPIFPPAQNLI